MNLITRHMTNFKRHLFKSKIHTHPQTPPPLVTLSHPILYRLESCTTLTQFNEAHAQIITSGLSAHPFASSRLLKFTASFPALPLTALVFSQIKDPDAFSYNLFIKALSQSSRPLDSLSLYRALRRRDLLPNEYTFCFLLDCCSHGLALWEGRQLHAHQAKHGLDLTLFSATSLVHMYGECGALEDSLQVFDEMPTRSNATWGAVVDACVSCGDFSRGMEMFGRLRRLDVEPSNATLVTVLSACAELGDVVTGRSVHAYIAVKGMELNATLGTSLVDMYCKCGAVEIAVQAFSAMRIRGVASWNCLIHGLAVNGHGGRAVKLFDEMQHEAQLRPNRVTFIGLLLACSHAGLVEDGIRYFADMKRVYGVEPELKQFGCMVDIYGRAGRVSEAVELVKGMPVQPDAVIWMALFCACRIHGLTKLGEALSAMIIKVVPGDACGYLLLSDMSAVASNWDDVVGARKLMREMDIRKVPGFSSISTAFTYTIKQPFPSYLNTQLLL